MSDQTNWYVLVKRIHYTKYLNTSTFNWTTFWNQKLWSGIFFSNKNDQTKKLFWFELTELIEAGQEESYPSPPTCLRTCVYAFSKKIN